MKTLAQSITDIFTISHFHTLWAWLGMLDHTLDIVFACQVELYNQFIVSMDILLYAKIRLKSHIL